MYQKIEDLEINAFSRRQQLGIILYFTETPLLVDDILILVVVCSHIMLHYFSATGLAGEWF